MLVNQKVIPKNEDYDDSMSEKEITGGANSPLRLHIYNQIRSDSQRWAQIQDVSEIMGQTEARAA